MSTTHEKFRELDQYTQRFKQTLDGYLKAITALNNLDNNIPGDHVDLVRGIEDKILKLVSSVHAELNQEFMAARK